MTILSFSPGRRGLAWLALAAGLAAAGAVAAAPPARGGASAAPLPSSSGASESGPASLPAASGAQAADAVRQALGASLRADVPAALAALRAAPAEQFDRKDAAFRSCMLQRHDRHGPPPSADPPSEPLAAQMLAIYQRYWWRAVRDPQQRPALEATLKRELAGLLGEPPPAEGEQAFEALQERLDARLRALGLNPLQGRTPPLYDLFLWRRQSERDYVVDLPVGVRQPVKVFLMDDWISRGWSHYTACGASGAAGWVKPEGLYAVHASYGDLSGEDFQVRFLGHEAQHFADLARWPTLPPWRLEYRAKLVELAKAEHSHPELLERFGRSRDDVPDHPHPYANKRVLADLAAALGASDEAALAKTDPARLRRAAVELLQADTRRLERDPPPPAPAEGAREAGR